MWPVFHLSSNFRASPRYAFQSPTPIRITPPRPTSQVPAGHESTIAVVLCALPLCEAAAVAEQDRQRREGKAAVDRGTAEEPDSLQPVLAVVGGHRERLLLPAEGFSTGLASGAVCRVSFFVDQEVDRPLLAAQRFLHISPLDVSSFASLSLLSFLFYSFFSFSLFLSSSFFSFSSYFLLFSSFLPSFSLSSLFSSFFSSFFFFPSFSSSFPEAARGAYGIRTALHSGSFSSFFFHLFFLLPIFLSLLFLPFFFFFLPAVLFSF